MQSPGEHQPSAGRNFIHHCSLAVSIQAVFYPANSVPVQAVSSQFLQENAERDSVKSFSQVQVDNIPSFSHPVDGSSGHRREITLVKQDLPLLNPCWVGLIPWLPCTWHSQNFFLISNQNLPSFSVKLFPLFLLLHALVKSSSTALL